MVNTNGDRDGRARRFAPRRARRRDAVFRFEPTGAHGHWWIRSILGCAAPVNGGGSAAPMPRTVFDRLAILMPRPAPVLARPAAVAADAIAEPLPAHRRASRPHPDGHRPSTGAGIASMRGQNPLAQQCKMVNRIAYRGSRWSVCCMGTPVRQCKNAGAAAPPRRSRMMDARRVTRRLQTPLRSGRLLESL